MPECTEDRAKHLERQAKFRAKTMARRIKNDALRRTPEQSGSLRRGWRCKRFLSGVVRICNVQSYAVFVERDQETFMLRAAFRKRCPAVHVDAMYDPNVPEVVLEPWPWYRILSDADCKPARGSCIELPARRTPPESG